MGYVSPIEKRTKKQNYATLAKNFDRQKKEARVRAGSPMLLSVGKFVFIMDKRVEVVEQPNTGDWILVIKVTRHLGPHLQSFAPF